MGLKEMAELAIFIDERICDCVVVYGYADDAVPLKSLYTAVDYHDGDSFWCDRSDIWSLDNRIYHSMIFDFLV